MRNYIETTDDVKKIVVVLDSVVSFVGKLFEVLGLTSSGIKVGSTAGFIIGGVATILSGGEVLLAVGLGMVGGVIGGFVGKKIEEKIERVQEGNNNNQAARRELQEGAIEIEAIEIEAPNENVPQQQRMLRLRCSGGRLFAIPVAHEAEVRGDKLVIEKD